MKNKNNEKEVVRKNIRMSPNIAKWYEEKAKFLGISQSNLMVMALNDYMKQEKAVQMMSNFEYVMSQLEELKKEDKPSQG